jgi:hypothetical protein
VYVEGGGPFYNFLELVLKPLQRHLRDRGLAPVTVAKIVRVVTDNFPRSALPYCSHNSTLAESFPLLFLDTQHNSVPA